MRIECHITKVEDIGDKLRVHMQGCGISEPDGARWAPQDLEIPATQAARRAFYVGRRCMLELLPLPALT